MSDAELPEDFMSSAGSALRGAGNADSASFAGAAAHVLAEEAPVVLARAAAAFKHGPVEIKAAKLEGVGMHARPTMTGVAANSNRVANEIPGGVVAFHPNGKVNGGSAPVAARPSAYKPGEIKAANENIAELKKAEGSRPVGAAPAEAPDMTDHAIGALTSVRRAADMVWMPGAINMQLPGAPMALPVPVASIIAGGAGYLAKAFGWLGWKGGSKGAMSASSAVKMALTPFEVMHLVPVGKALRDYPGMVVRAVADHAANENSYLTKFAPRLNGMADNVDMQMAGVATRASERMAPKTAVIGRAVDRFGASSVGRTITDATADFFNRRHTKAVARATRNLDAAHAAFMQETPGFLTRIKNKLLGRTTKAVPLRMPGDFAKVLEHVDTAKVTADVAGRMDALEQAHGALIGLKENGVYNEVIRGHAVAVEKKLGKALGAVSKQAGLASVMDGGVAAWLKNISPAFAKVPLYKAVIGVTILAGALAAFLGAGKATGEANRALADFKADAGADSELVKAAEKNMGLHTAGRFAGAAVGSAAEGFMLHPAQGMAFPAMMGLGMAGGVLGGGSSAAINAHATLHKAELGQLQLDADDKVKAVAEIIASVPAVAAVGGIFTQQTQDDAQAFVREMDAGRMKLRDVLHTIDTPELLNAFTLKEKKARAAAETVSVPVMSELPKAATDVPKVQISAATAQHDGAVHEGRRQVG